MTEIERIISIVKTAFVTSMCSCNKKYSKQTATKVLCLEHISVWQRNVDSEQQKGKLEAVEVFIAYA